MSPVNACVAGERGRGGSLGGRGKREEGAGGKGVTEFVDPRAEADRRWWWAGGQAEEALQETRLLT